MANEYWFSKVQYGVEQNRGTAVSANRLIVCPPFAIKSDRKPQLISGNYGIRAQYVKTHIYEYLVRDTLKIPNLYYDILPALLLCSVDGNPNIAELTTGQGDYLWTFEPNLTGDGGQKSLTLEMGDDTQAFECEYTMFERLRFSASIPQDGGDAPVSVEADYFARQLTPTTFTSSPTIPSLQILNAKKSKLYIDNSWANVGTTLKSGILRSWDVEILSGLNPNFTGADELYFTSHGQSAFDITLRMTLVGTSIANNLMTSLRNQTFGVYQLVVPGNQIGSGEYYLLSFRIGGYVEDFVPLNENDRGINLSSVLIHGVYDNTAAKLFNVSVVNNRQTP